MPPSPASAGRRSIYPLLVALCAALLLLRRPESLLHPQFWAEDGSLFFQDAFNLGFLETVARPVAGYFLTFPRLIAGVSLLFPMELAPLIFNAAAFIVQLAPAWYLLSPRMRPLLPAPAAQAAAALICVALPASYETHVNLSNSQWHLALTMLCILLAQPAASARVRALEVGVSTLFSVSGPFSILFLPIVAARLIRTLRCARPDGPLAPAIAIAAGAAVQAVCTLTSARVGGAAAPWGRLGFQEMATVVSMHTFFAALFGVNGLSRFHRSLPPAAYWLGLLALALLLAVVIRDRVRPLLALFYLATLSIALSFTFPLNDPKLWLHPQAGPRYFLYACLFVLLALLHLACGPRPWRWLGAAGLGVALAFGIPADFVHPRLPDTRWPDQVAVFRSLPAGSDFYVPVVPLFHGGMVLRKTSQPQPGSPLGRLKPIPSPSIAEATVSRPKTLLLTRVPNDSFLRIDGWAIDGAAAKPASGVFVKIDDKLFPAAYGLPAEISHQGRSYPACGFTRLIPIAEIGPGPHQLSVLAITADRTGYYRATEPRAFSLSQFFP